jgi:hypothetical protein
LILEINSSLMIKISNKPLTGFNKLQIDLLMPNILFFSRPCMQCHGATKILTNWISTSDDISAGSC